MREQKVLLAVGESNLSALIRSEFTESNSDKSTYDVLYDEVLHRRFIQPMTLQYQPDILIIHDSFLSSSYTEQLERDDEILKTLRELRMSEIQTRIIYICQRSSKDQFLGRLVALGVYDIFHQHQFSSTAFRRQLSEPSKFSNVSQFGVSHVELDLPEVTVPNSIADTEVDEEPASQRGIVSDLLQKLPPFRKSEEKNVSNNSEQDPAVKENEGGTGQLCNKVSADNEPDTEQYSDEDQLLTEKEENLDTYVDSRNYLSVPSKIIVIGSLYPGAGSTLLATNLARMIAKREVDVAYVEHPFVKPYMFDYLQIHVDEVDESEPYKDIAKEIDEHGMILSKGAAFKKHGVRWYVNDSRQEMLKEFSYEQLLTLSHGIQATVLILDISNLWLEKGIQKFLYLADALYLCVEPDPVKNDWVSINTHEKKIMEFLTASEQLEQFQYVLMKNVTSVDIKMIKEMLYKKPLTSVPYFDYAEVKQALFKSKFLYDVGYDNEFEKSLEPLIKDFLPKKLLQLKRKEKSLLGRFRKN
ncbi:hypothetical protein ABD91_01870 [Lysinibacillus sphaericus]|uniref:hypothetical protein n=1 Tax=Lysinibacillus sphaericus TaxID=1421 RepID=UPI0018CDFE8A|nr:hypothetical protein [Lysinibacillus sphaericus]MBG9689673.1 hypothetical protein [Lysinibacillus sphaericus]